MATINENLNVWSNYKWEKDGNEWSEYWGGTDYLMGINNISQNTDLFARKNNP